MRDNFNFSMLPIVQDSMNYAPGGVRTLSSNGYYGYQPLSRKEEAGPPCLMELEAAAVNARKRAWDHHSGCDGVAEREFKKRRQNAYYFN